ncbi:Pleckstrin homology domain-containing protein [Glomus cerebriforme]|uniref:Pleckstrin homology domain-containing protein n=1 Tax=Glomus cerebriforme TaxID=658196 RepID=A0A397TMQ1_9GLOM|nr:Pleckstrin homology domain-containing protein [Glomus cerebriforme]
MESSPSLTAFNPSNSSQTLRLSHQNSLSSDLFNNNELLNRASFHLHSTSRRIFIGPTPINWSYKKKSFFFSKSHSFDPIIKNNSSRKNKNINKNERRETFVASRDSIGPKNLSSLDFYEFISKSQRKSDEIITDSMFLVSEPENLDPGPSSNTIKSYSKSPDVFYTPTDDINTNPISPPNLKHAYFPSPLKLEKNEDIPSHVLPTSIEDNKPSEQFYTPTDVIDKNLITESRDVVDKQFNQENDNINHETLSSIDENSERNIGNKKPRHVSFSSSTATTKPSKTIIKQDPMLVRIDCEDDDTEELLRNDFGYHYNQSVGWKELMVKLKPTGIEFYESKDKLVENIYFTSTTKLSIFSSTDYTISITQPTKHCRKNFILNPRTITSSIQWYQTLYKSFPELVNKPIPYSLEVVIPDLDVKVRIPIYDNNNEEGGGCENNDEEPKLKNLTAEKVLNVALNELSDIAEWSDVLIRWLKSNNLRLCWKRYEKLEWINSKGNESIWNDLLNCPQFVEQTHQLQLRSIEHYPTTVKLNDGTLNEPPPIEGYLIKTTNNKGENKKSERLYFTSQNNYLFFLNPLKANPPPPPNTVTTDEDGIQICDNSQEHPLIYAISPFIQDKIIGENNTFMKSDMKRRIKQLLCAIGFIDLIEIVEIKCLKNDGTIEENLEEENLEEEEQVNDGEGCPFQLLLKNGGIVTLKAYSKQTRKEWVNHLNELAKYWKARLKQDVKIRVDMIKTNQSIYQENDDALYNHNWDNFKSYVDPVLWNWCVLEGCRGIIKSGLLYHKTHLRQPFQIYHHILTRGHFLYFNHHVRSTLTGCVLNRSYYKRKGCIDLRDCYVYSGSITEHEYYNSNLAQELSIAKSYSQGHLMKIYGDGMISYDNYKDTSFVIWKSKRKYYYSDDKMKINMKKKIKFGTPGKFWVFRTRNRVECEEWVWALNVEIERLRGEEEVDEIRN